MNKITPFETYSYFLAMKLHFQKEKYDFFEYNKKTNATEFSFNKRKDKFFFERLAAKYDSGRYTEKLLVAALNNPKFYIKDIINEENDKKVRVWKGYLESFHYKFEQELLSVSSEYSLRDFLCDGKKHSPLLKEYLAGKISKESMICLDLLLTLFEKYDKIYSNDLVWSSFVLRKYKPFIEEYIDKKKSLKILREVFEL